MTQQNIDLNKVIKWHQKIESDSLNWSPVHAYTSISLNKDFVLGCWKSCSQYFANKYYQEEQSHFLCLGHRISCNPLRYNLLLTIPVHSRPRQGLKLALKSNLPPHVPGRSHFHLHFVCAVRPFLLRWSYTRSRPQETDCRHLHPPQTGRGYLSQWYSDWMETRRQLINLW